MIDKLRKVGVSFKLWDGEGQGGKSRRGREKERHTIHEQREDTHYKKSTRKIKGERLTNGSRALGMLERLI